MYDDPSIPSSLELEDDDAYNDDQHSFAEGTEPVSGYLTLEELESIWAPLVKILV